jgi:tetratricopeptide (TPR) repeat protein
MSPERSKEWNARTILGCDADYRPPLNILCNPEGFQEPEKERDEYLEVLWKLYREERTYMTAKRGPNDPYTLGVQYQIAGIYGRKGNFIRAIIVYRYIFDVSQEHLGGQDPLSIRAIEGLARCFQAQGNHGKASKWVRRLQYLG